jgi:exosortase family protein XrtM
MTRHTPSLAFIVVFALIYLAFYALYCVIPDAILIEQVYRWGINEPAASVIRMLAPMEAVRVEGHRLLSPRVALEIVRGCDGSGAFFLASAAMLAFSAPLTHKLVGVASAFAIIFVLNEARVISLYFVAGYRPQWFTPLHSYVIPTFLIAAISLHFVIWARAAVKLDEIAIR